MATKKDKTMLWVVLILGGGAAYWYLNSQKASAAPPPPPATTTPPVVPPLPPAMPATQNPAPMLQYQVTPPVGILAPATMAPTITSAASMPNTAQLQTLQNWAQTSMNPCDLARWNSAQSGFGADASAHGYPTEWAGLVDLYFNDWQEGQGTNDQRTQFWDYWRTKYSILTNTPC